MTDKPQPKRSKESEEDFRIKQLIKERSDLNEGLNSLLEKITKTPKRKKNS